MLGAEREAVLWVELRVLPGPWVVVERVVAVLWAAPSLEVVVVEVWDVKDVALQAGGRGVVSAHVSQEVGLAGDAYQLE